MLYTYGKAQILKIQTCEVVYCRLVLRPPNGSVDWLYLFGFCFLAVPARIKEALSSVGPRISHVQGEALSEFQAAALLPRAPAAFTCI